MKPRKFVPGRPSVVASAVALLRMLAGRGETEAERRHRLDRKAAIERAAKERL